MFSSLSRKRRAISNDVYPEKPLKRRNNEGFKPDPAAFVVKSASNANSGTISLKGYENSPSYSTNEFVFKAVDYFDTDPAKPYAQYSFNPTVNFAGSLSDGSTLLPIAVELYALQHPTKQFSLQSTLPVVVGNTSGSAKGAAVEQNNRIILPAVNTSEVLVARFNLKELLRDSTVQLLSLSNGRVVLGNCAALSPVDFSAFTEVVHMKIIIWFSLGIAPYMQLQMSPALSANASWAGPLDTVNSTNSRVILQPMRVTKNKK